jgi:hypothetical protein
MIGVIHQNPSAVTQPFGGPSAAFVQTNFVPLTYVVPREIWQGKPSNFSDIGYSLNSVLTGTPLQSPTGGYVSTIFGVGYVFGGFVGVLIFLVVLGLVASRVDVYLKQANWNCLSVIYYGFLLNITFQAFRQGTVGWTFINGVVSQLGFILGLLILALLYRTYRSSTADGAGVSYPGPARPQIAPRASHVGSAVGS